jgi:outer membrane protein assembly factor BamD (BamD/ComL family)
MIYVFRSAVVAIFIAVIGVCLADAQGLNSITGFVFGENRLPLSRVHVELQTDMYSTLVRTQTNDSGMFSFRGIPNGQFYVKVLPYGTDYHEQSRSVTLSPIGRGGVSEQIDFYLKLRKTGTSLGAPEVVFVQEVPPRAKELYEAGVKELENKNEKNGYEKLKQALETFPQYFAALDRLGNEYLNKGYYDVSFVLFTKAIEVNPRSISSNLGLGISDYKINRLPEAIEALENVIRLHKANVNAHYWLGVVHHASGKLGEAVDYLQKAEKLSERKSSEVQWQLARVYKDQNKFKESADALELYLKLKPDAENAEEIRRIIKLLRGKQAS